MTLTPGFRRALEILRDHGPIQPSRFAKFMWPDSEKWSNHVGRGSHQGGGMYLAGGWLLGKLQSRGWAKRSDREFHGVNYHLTGEGRAALRENPEVKP